MTVHTYVNGTFYVDCPFCGTESEMPLDKVKYFRWQAGELAQNVWPEMSLEDREVLISGTCRECQKILFAMEE